MNEVELALLRVDVEKWKREAELHEREARAARIACATEVDKHTATQAELKQFCEREPHVQALVLVAGQCAGTLLAASIMPTPKRPDLAAQRLREASSSIVDAAALVMGRNAEEIRAVMAQLVASVSEAL